MNYDLQYHHNGSIAGNTGMSLKLSILNKKKELVYTDLDIATLVTDKVK